MRVAPTLIFYTFVVFTHRSRNYCVKKFHPSFFNMSVTSIRNVYVSLKNWPHTTQLLIGTGHPHSAVKKRVRTGTYVPSSGSGRRVIRLLEDICEPREP